MVVADESGDILPLIVLLDAAASFPTPHMISFPIKDTR